MGYQINSTWTKLREKDIKKLNEIIDDEYCRELEIGRKLNIMKKFNEAFNKAVSEFRFDIVLDFMKEHNWEWFHYENGKSFYAVPTEEHMIDVMKNDYLKHGLYEIIELGKTSFSMSGGGIVFSMDVIGNECYVEIGFDIAHFTKD
jgi:hypothetical protein